MDSTSITSDCGDFSEEKKTYETQRINQQKLEWFSMKKRIEELIEKVGTFNVQTIARQILNENLILGRGLFCQAIMKSQMKSPQLSHIYASLVAIINSELPQVGYLLVQRLVLQFRKTYDHGKDKKYLMNISKFLAHLMNQIVVDIILGQDIILILLLKPSSDNIEVAVKFCIECGSLLQENMPDKLREICREFRSLVSRNVVDKRVQILILRLFRIKRSYFEKYPRVIDELDLVELGEQVTHHVTLLEDVHDMDPETYADNFEPNSEIGELDMHTLRDIQSKNAEDGEVTSQIRPK